MPARLRKDEDPDREKAALLAALEDRLGTVMGVRLTPLEWLIRSREPIPLALALLLLQGAGAGLVIWWSSGDRAAGDAHARIASLLIWYLHFPILAAIGRLYTIRCLDIVRRDILPFATERYATAAREALAAQQATLAARIVPPLLALFFLAACLWTLRDEIAPAWSAAPIFPPDLLFWAGTVLVTCYLQMQVVVVGAFPRAFADALALDRARLYPPDAAATPLVQGLARLNWAVLAFFAIAFLVWSSIMLLLVPEAPFGMDDHSPFLFVLVPIVGFCDVGVAALVYLTAEARIGTTLRRYAQERAEALQGEVIALLDPPWDDASAARLDRLTRLHGQILAGGRYGSHAGQAVSLVLPLTLPAIGIIEKIFR
jgi:hypothetical protein